MFNFIGKALAANPIVPTPVPLGVLDPARFKGSAGMNKIITGAIGWLLVIAGAIAVIYLIYGGLLYITAGGDAEKATKGRTALINAIIGIVIIALAFVIVSWINSIIGTS